MTERNLKCIKGRNGRPAHYVTELTIGYKRIRRFAGFTKEEARDFIAKLRRAGRDGELEAFLKPEANKQAMTFGDYARELLDSAQWKHKRSARRDEFSLKQLNREFKLIPLNEISPARARAYMSERLKKLSPASVNRELSLLKSILNCAVYDGLLLSNPIQGRRVKKLEENNSRERSILEMNLSSEKLRELIDRSPALIRPIVQLALLTGMRKGEILRMKWSEVDLERGSIFIPALNAKSKRSRSIALDQSLISMLDSLPRKSEYVFSNPMTGRPFTEIRKSFSAALRAAKIRGLRFHDLRHIAAFNLVKLTNLPTASKILGHADIKMTMRYCHPSEADQRLAIKRMSDELLRGRQKSVNAPESPVMIEKSSRSLIH